LTEVGRPAARSRRETPVTPSGKRVQHQRLFADKREVTTHARFVGSGVQPLVDAVKAAGADPGDLRAVVWQATWARGYEDVVAPAPAIRLKEEGFVVFARPVGTDRSVTVVDTTHALWALVARGDVPPLGSRVRVVPAFIDGEIGWDLTIIETLGLGLVIRFTPKTAADTNAWAERLRAALFRIDQAQVAHRKAIVAERRALITLDPVKPFKEEVEALHEALRLRVDAETAGTAAERLAFERGNEKQRKAIVDECKLRRRKRYDEEMALLRERIPELQAIHNERTAALADVRSAVAELEDAASSSRSVTERIATVRKRLASVETAGLVVSGDLDALDNLGSTDFEEICRTVELLDELIPRRGLKR
jgi:hypothetical protein